MRAITAQVGDVAVLIETVDEQIPDELSNQHSRVGGSNPRERSTIVTGIETDLVDAFGTAKRLLSNLANELSATFIGLAADQAPKRVTVELGISFSAKAGVWVITGEGNGSMKVTLEWQGK